ncbi:MAG: adenylate/guanylate cyclase domain-containing protein, partial [Pseudohongiella sp.]|nr:adenylate/guanylate cyclase domain-containing protein [Pseudohongiella sp.]
FDREFIDFSIEQWALGIRARLLVRMNRMDEAQACLKKMVSANEGLNDPVIGQITHHIHVELAAMTQDAALAREHAAVVIKIAEQYASPYSRIFALWSSGLAEVSVGNLTVAQDSFLSALELIASSRVAVEFEAEIRAGIAECHQYLGDAELALASAKEAIAISRQRSNRLAECRALIVWGAVLASKNEPEKVEEAHDMFEQAAQLISQTGAKIFENSLARAKALLPAGL